MYTTDQPSAFLSGFPAVCLELVPDQGFRWLCGEPVPPEVQTLLATSSVVDPVVDTVEPGGEYVPSTPGGETEEENGYGFAPWLIGLLLARLMSEALR